MSYSQTQVSLGAFVSGRHLGFEAPTMARVYFLFQGLCLGSFDNTALSVTHKASDTGEKPHPLFLIKKNLNFSGCGALNGLH